MQRQRELIGGFPFIMTCGNHMQGCLMRGQLMLVLSPKIWGLAGESGLVATLAASAWRSQG